MTGYHSAPVIAEALVKGFDGIDAAAAYPLLKKRAMDDDYRGLGYYRKLGYIPCDKEEESATKTLEYSYDDWAVAQVAKVLGKTEDYQFFLARSRNYRNLWDKETGFIRPRLENGAWAAPFDPKQTGTTKKWRDFTEANSWQASWQAQHDPQGYIELLGGREALVAEARLAVHRKHEIERRSARRYDRAGRHVCARQRAEPSRGIPVRLCRRAVQNSRARARDSGHAVSTTRRTDWPATKTAGRCRPGTPSARSAFTRWIRPAETMCSARRCSRRP